jgi:hypothetical protein
VFLGVSIVAFGKWSSAWFDLTLVCELVIKMDPIPWRLPWYTFEFKNSLGVVVLAYLYLLALV